MLEFDAKWAVNNASPRCQRLTVWSSNVKRGLERNNHIIS